MQERVSLIVLIIISVVFGAAVIRVAASGEDSRCEHNTCSECISGLGCVWCSDPNIRLVMVVDTGRNLTHCISNTSVHFEQFSQACKDSIINPKSEIVSVEDEESVVQLKPQRVSITMRAGDSSKITVKYKHPSEHPLDLYSLMDGSKSMFKLKNTLASVTNVLVDELSEMSNDIKLGFGMFIDKPMLPFTDMSAWSGRHCDGCVESFSFKHVLPLTSDRTLFQEKVNTTKGSTNVDSPEGTLDALMQVVSCPDKVHWREHGLKIVVVYTNAGFHIAGDGKLAGIYTPNDRKCHLDNNGQYTHSMWNDYPSINELESVLKDLNLFTMFAVTEISLLPLYRELTNHLIRSNLSVIESDSANLVNVITNFVRSSISTVTLKKPTNIMEEIVSLNVTTLCKGNQENDNSTCENMEFGDEAEFIINIKVKSCPVDNESPTTTTLNFTLDGYPQTFLLDLKLLCQCDCDQEDDKGFISTAAECNFRGDLKCGVCDCYEKYLGDKCQCVKETLSNEDVDIKNCIDPDSSNGLVCSGQGKCVCGQCQCNKNEHDPSKVITGDYCQCTNYKNCYGSSGEICSGNGKCVCNECKCAVGWTGEFCDCEESTSQCQPSTKDGGGGGGEVVMCSGHGECECNQCKCEEGYQGKYCQDCQNCEQKCDEHKYCVECLVFDAGESCQSTCSSYYVTIVPDITKEYGQLCTSTDDEGCRMLYQFKHNADQVLLWALSEKECPVEINPWVVVGAVLGVVLLVGVVLLITWKVIVHIKDERAYEKFMREKSMAIWSEHSSPLYKPPTTTIENPLYGNSLQD